MNPDPDETKVDRGELRSSRRASKPTVKNFAVVTSDMELVLDIVGALEAGGHRVELAEEAAQAMVLNPRPDALIVDAGVPRLDARVRDWADREGVAIVMVGPEAAAAVAARLGAGFIERPA